MRHATCSSAARAIFRKRFHRTGYCLSLFFIISVIGLNISYAAVIVRTEQAVYHVMPGETFDLRIYIDANDQTLGNAFEPLPGGLFSFGVKASFPVGLANVPSVLQVAPAAPLNYFGFSSGAMKQVTANSASAKGNIDPGSATAYSNSLLLTIQVTNLAPASSSYWLELDEWRTLGASEQIFITGQGGVLDTTPSTDLFLPALIVVVPEPSSFCLLLGTVPCAAGVRRRYRVAQSN